MNGVGAPPMVVVAASPPPPSTTKQPTATASPPPAAVATTTTSPPPSPALPPAAPGMIVAKRVSTEFVLSGTVETFDADGFRAVLLKVFPSAVDIKLTVSAASVKVVSEMDFADPSAAEAALTTINTTPA